VAGQIPVGRRW